MSFEPPARADALSAPSPDAPSSGPVGAADDDFLGRPTLDRADLQALLGESLQGSDVKRARRVFVNRSLRMDETQVIGFDMDYTLAIYNQPRIEALSVQCTLDKLVNQRGYDRAILGLDFDPSIAIRGIVVDRVAGNVFKGDRYGHIGRVYHGSRPLGRDEKRALYHTQRIRLSSDRYAWIDTLFALPEAVMFSRIVEWMDASDQPRAYAKLWKDIRESIDEAHRDESMKRVIKANLGDFLERDPELAPTLHKLRSAGKRLFLLTNSYWDYTDQVMKWLLDGQLPTYASWRSYFDVVITGSQKPAFFTERRPFLELNDDGSERGPVEGSFHRGAIYQGGNIVDFEQLMRAPGDRVLYIGDHIYGDMLRAKKSTVWRTAMVIQELERELTLAESNAPALRKLEEQEKRLARIEAEINYQGLVLRSLVRLEDHPHGNGHAAPAPPVDARLVAEAIKSTRARLEKLKSTQREIGADVEKLEHDIDHGFNAWWGPMFKQGVENSRFGEQVEDYACLYTSRVSNFLAYSPLYYFRSPRDHMPHEL